MSTLQGIRHHDVDDIVKIIVNFKSVRVGLLTELALKILPEHHHHFAILEIFDFRAQPMFQALEMQKPHTSYALAGSYQWVSRC